MYITFKIIEEQIIENKNSRVLIIFFINNLFDLVFFFLEEFIDLVKVNFAIYLQVRQL